MKKLLKSKTGSATVLFLGLTFALLSLTLLIMELGSTYERYDHAMDVLQRSCNSAVEANIIDEYRADRILRLDTTKAKRDVQKYIREDMPDGYTVSISTISCSMLNPSMTVSGKISFPTMFSQYGFGKVTYSFKVRATNYDLD